MSTSVIVVFNISLLLQCKFHLITLNPHTSYLVAGGNVEFQGGNKAWCFS